MAVTSQNRFTFQKNLYAGNEEPSPIKVRVANSATLVIGDAVRVNNAGFLVRAAAGNPVAGILMGITDENGITPYGSGFVDNTGATKGSLVNDSIVTASDNQTRTHYIMGEVVLDPSGAILWKNIASAALAQTNLFQLFDVVAASNQIDQSTASDTSGQFQLVALDPDNDGDTTKGLFRISEPELMNQVGNQTTAQLIVNA